MVKTRTAEDQLLETVLQTFKNTPDPRLHEIIEALIRHLHAFARDVNLTHAEWEAGWQFLTEVGQFSNPTRQEFILLSDLLGLSSLVEMLDYHGADGSTEQTVLGPFYAAGSPRRQNGDSVIENDFGGQNLNVSGVVRSQDGSPIAGAEVDIWQTAETGFYPVQDEKQSPTNLRGLFITDEKGRYWFKSKRPVPYSVPTDGPAGRLLKAGGRHPMRAAHVHVIVRAEGHYPVTTHIFDSEDTYLDSDAVFGVRDSLIKKFEKQPDGELAVVFDVMLTPKEA